MASYVSIIEDSTQGRLLLGSLLSAGHYKVETVSLEDCPSARSNVAPNLIIVGPSFAEPENVLEMISRSGLSAGVPVLVLARYLDAAKRLKLILKGAREVLEYPLTDSLLLARIRTLLREADAFKEIRRRRSALSTVGFHESGPAFAATRRVTFVREQRANEPLPDCGKATGWFLVGAAVAEALSPAEESPQPSGYVLDWRGTKLHSQVQRALPELRDRLHSRHAAILVLVDETDTEATLQALDTGASDVVPGNALPDEIGFRISRALEQKLAEDALRQSSEDSLALAMTDELTGLYNRRYAERYLARLLKDRTPDQPFALMMADIDRFKAINDKLGHAAGDAVIKEVAARLRSEVRSIDLVARYGGEEFLVVLAESDRKQATRAADRLRRSIGHTPVRLPEHGTIDVTVSIGVSFGDGFTGARQGALPLFDSALQGGAVLSHLLSQADRALYSAKEHGRNQVRLAVNSA